MPLDLNRRDMLKAAAGAALLVPQRVLGANDRVRVAVVGLRGRGLDHLRKVKDTPGVELAAVVDIDENVIATRLGEIGRAHV